MAATNFQTGYYGTATVNGANEVPVVQWTGDLKSMTEKFFNSQTGPFPVYRGTFKECPITLNLDYDPANDVFASPFSIAVGTVLGQTNLYLNQSAKSTKDGPFLGFSNFYVETTPIKCVINGKNTIQVTGYGFGTLTMP